MKKKKFIVSVQETLNRLVCVEANSYDEAVDAAYEAWKNSEIVLTEDDFTGDVEIDYYSDDPTEIEMRCCKDFING